MIVQDYSSFPRALAFDDVLLVPQKSSVVSRTQIDLSTQIAPNIKLAVPLISMSMDTVTGVDMAIAIAKFGGIGFLPRFYLPEIQADNVKTIKKAG